MAVLQKTVKTLLWYRGPSTDSKPKLRLNDYGIFDETDGQKLRWFWDGQAWSAPGAASHSHLSLTGIDADQHHVQAHVAAHKSGGADPLTGANKLGPLEVGLAHGDLSVVTTDQHHAQVHAAEGAAHSFPGGTTNYLREDGTWQVPTAAHPDLAAHDALGLATQAELDGHAVAADPHTGYVQESDHGGVSPAGHHAAFVQADHDALPNPHHSNINDHTQAHTPESHTSQLATAAQLNELVGGGVSALHSHAGGGGAWTTKVKTADQTNNTSILVDDDTLQFNTVANTKYTIRLRAFLLTNATADSKYRLVHTGTTTRVRRRIMRTATTDIAQTFELKTAFDAADVVLSTTGLNPNFEEDIILQVGASGGVLKLQFGQVTTNAGPTSLLGGSYLEYAIE